MADPNHGQGSSPYSAWGWLETERCDDCGASYQTEHKESCTWLPPGYWVKDGCWGVSVDPTLSREAPNNNVQVGIEDTDELAAQVARRHFETIYFRFLKMPDPVINDHGLDRRRFHLVVK